PRGEARNRQSRTGGGALRRAPGEAVLRRACRVHHLGPDVGARGRGRRSDRNDARDDRRHRSGGRGPGDDPRRPRLVDARPPRARLRPARRGRPRDRSLVRMTHPNVEDWTRANAEYTDARAEQAWARDGITYGVWSVPESELHALPGVAGKDVVELGCGTAYFGAWLKKAGAARVVG